MAQEIKRALQFFYSSSQVGEVDQVILAGGCAAINRIAALIEQEIGKKVTVANPFAHMSIADRVKKEPLMNDAPAMMIACGLALRSFDYGSQNQSPAMAGRAPRPAAQRVFHSHGRGRSGSLVDGVSGSRVLPAAHFASGSAQ
jgi:Type IV pilus assembly protein PilM